MNILPQIGIEPQHQPTDDGLWYKDAIIYQLHVKAFADANNDGVGDFAGLTAKLDYLQDLGVNTLWLLPFYPSPGRDDGYDISDYGDINPQFGTMKDFRRFMTEAKRRNLRVITELVVNHTSDQHDWFKRSRRSPAGSSARDWYVWSDTDQKYTGTRIIFTDTEKSNWTWDTEAGAFYWHRFFSHQPDLNFDNPRVVSAVVQVMKRWLDAGVDGFRLDAVPYLVEREGTNNENLPETHAILKTLRKELDAYAPNKVLLAEANQWPEDVQHYFGNGDECQMAYHFPLMPRIYMAIAQEDRFPIADIMRQTPDIPPNCQWAMFLRNHDELTLEMVTDIERDYLWSTYASDPRARINVGIRRRLAPLMDNDRRKIELMNSLLFSMPGTPIIYYGDEIGMGDNIYLGDRNGVRTPMQWTSDRNGGFSRADPAQLYLPCIMDPVYGYDAVNVEAQNRSLSSLLSWMKRLISVRKTSKVFGRGSLSFIRPKNRSVLAYVRQYENEAIVCIANLSRAAQAAEIDLSAFKGRVPLEMLGRTRFPRIGELPYLVTLPPYGFFWFLLCDEAEKPEAHVPHEFHTLVFGAGWDALRQGFARRVFENDVLPTFLSERRWFAQKGKKKPVTKLAATIPLDASDDQFLLAFVDVEGAEAARYLIPLTVEWKRFDRVESDPKTILSAVRRGPREGTLLDATAWGDFATAVLAKIHGGQTASDGAHTVEFTPTAPFKEAPAPVVTSVKAVNAEQSNTAVIIDDNFVMKVLRQVNPGVHPEIEIGRFLTEHTQFKNAPALLGSIELIEGEQRSAIGVLHQFVENQGDAWALTGSYLDRFVEEERLLSEEPSIDTPDRASLIQRMRQIGRRTAELHQALASTDLPGFAPEPIEPADMTAWADRLTEQSQDVIEHLIRQRDLAEAPAQVAKTLIANRDRIAAHIREFGEGDITAMKIRHHGDFHLGQVLIAKEDAYILDFEGEPRRTLEERRRKAPAARDVAGLIRSIDYATVSALTRVPDLKPEELPTLSARFDAWRLRLSEAFWHSYQETMTDKRLWPADQAQSERLLHLFLLEKAFYELEYELTHRPAWLPIPLNGTYRILVHAGALPA